MKKGKLIFALLSVITGFPSAVQAQDEGIRHIAETEMRAHAVLTAKAPAGVVNNYDLKYHRFHWEVDPAVTAVSGSVVSYFTATEDMNSIQFELKAGLSADSAFHGGSATTLSHAGDKLTIGFKQVVHSGTLDSVTVYYHGSPVGSGFGSFATGVHNNVPMLWTLSEPYGASEWWPSKNDLTDKIDSIDVYVAAPDEYKVASNGTRISETPAGLNKTLVHWKHRHPIASYLIAIAVTNYAEYSHWLVKEGDSLEIKNFVFPENLSMRKIQTPQTVSFMELFEDLFGAYPFRPEKYGQAEFGWGGGMEHQTITFLGSGAFNFNVISHELAHHWFGDMVTCGSWHDIWLNEGFATYLNGLAIEHIVPDPYWPIWKYQNISNVTSQPGGSVYCDDTTDVGRIFDSRLSYAKGGMVLHMLRWVIGDSAFFAGMNNYLEDPRLRHGFAFTQDFKAHVEAASGRDLTWFFRDWIYGEGYPIYNILCGTVDRKNIWINVMQMTSHPSVDFFALPVPVRFYGGGRDTTLVVNNTYNGESFFVSLDFEADSVVFDPDLWLISSQQSAAYLGKDDLPSGKWVELAPNPAGDYLTVKQNLGKITEILVCAVTGSAKPFRPEFSGDETLKVNVSGLSPGVYLLRMKAGECLVSGKFIILR